MKNNKLIGTILGIVGIVVLLFGIIKMTNDNSSNLPYTVIGLSLTITGSILLNRKKPQP